MISTKDAILALAKSIDGTMKAAKLAPASAKTPEDFAEPMTFSGEIGEVELSLEENILNIKCKAEGQDFKTVAQTLFDPSEEDWDEKSTRSVANVICEAVSTYFGTECIFAGKTAKAEKPEKKAVEAVAEAPKKSKKKETNSYEPEVLAIRMENIFQDLKGEMLKNIDKYDIFLPEEYFENLATPKIIDAIKINDRPVMKKIFNTFNTFYEEGDNQVQSLIVVSILGMNFAKDDSLLKNCESLMDKDLHDAVLPVVTYLKTGSGAKKRIGKFSNPTPAKK